MAVTPTRQDSRFFTEQLPNGLQLLGQQIPGVQSAAAVFWVRTGTRDEPPAQMGVSHFLEHMAFKRTASHTSEEVDRLFEEMGADHNAFTSWEMTAYWARVLSDNVEPVIQLLSELTHPVIDPEDFDSERKVILEEIARYEDQPSHVLFSSHMKDYYGDHPLAMDTLGTPETLNALTPEAMRSYWERRYGTRNMIFAIAGNFDWPRVVDQVQRLSTPWKGGDTGRALGGASFTPSFKVYQNEKFVQQQIAIGTPNIGRHDERFYAASVLAAILGDDTGSRLYWAVNQPGLADSATAQLLEFEDTGSMFIHIAAEPALAQQALDAVETEMKRLQQGHIEQSELDRAKAKMNSSVVIGGESTNERVMGLISSWLTQERLETLEEVRRKIESVTLDDLANLLREFPVWPHQVITAVGPMDPHGLRPVA